MQKGILYLSNEDVKKVLDLGRAIEITEQALRDHSEGRVIWSTPEDLAIKPEQGWQSWVTGCALATEPVAGFRIRSIKAAGGSRDVSRPPRGPRRILILCDREGGEIRAMMDEDWCHAVRTAAAATVAMRVLARKGAAIMAMLGAGDTARAAVPVMAKAFPLKEIRVTSRTPESRQQLCRGSGRRIWPEYSAGRIDRGSVARRRFGGFGDDNVDSDRKGRLARRRNHGVFHRQASGNGERRLQESRQIRGRQLGALQEQIRHAAHAERKFPERKRSLCRAAGASFRQKTGARKPSASASSSAPSAWSTRTSL